MGTEVEGRYPDPLSPEELAVIEAEIAARYEWYQRVQMKQRGLGYWSMGMWVPGSSR